MNRNNIKFYISSNFYMLAPKQQRQVSVFHNAILNNKYFPECCDVFFIDRHVPGIRCSSIYYTVYTDACNFETLVGKRVNTYKLMRNVIKLFMVNIITSDIWNSIARTSMGFVGELEAAPEGIKDMLTIRYRHAIRTGKF